LSLSKIKDKLKDVKDKVVGTGEDAKDKVVGVGEGVKDTVTASSTSGGTGAYEEGAPGTEKGRKDDPLTSYREKEPMTPAKIKEHEPTAVKREMTEKITEPGQIGGGTSPEEAAEIARKKGMAKGTAGAAETGSEYEQGAAGTYASKTDTGGKNWQKSSENVRSDIEEEISVPVMEEDLEISKRESIKGEATITKEPITKTKEVEVPVTHEEAVIERRPANSSSTVAPTEIPSKIEVNVPLKSEEVEVTKQPYVKEEVSVKKRPVTETQKVSEEVKSEQLNVEGNRREE
jgi:uncharacterized protein (TIGR02271 family)